MARTVDKMLLEMVVENKKAIKNINAVRSQGKQLDKESQGFFKRMKVGWLAIAAVVYGAIRVIGNLVSKASEAEETFSKFSTVFKDVAKESEKMAKSLSDDFGLSSLKAKQLLADTGDLLTGFGFTGKSALKLSTEVNELAVDLASFTNFSGGAEGASKALTKALLGERESVKSLGIAILESDVKAKIKALEIAGRFTDETEREKKAIATLQIAVEQSQNAIGDFARTQKSWANQTRVLKGKMEDLSVVIGGFFKTILTPMLPILIKVTGQFSKWAEESENLKKELAEVQSQADVALTHLKKYNITTNEQLGYLRKLSSAYQDLLAYQKLTTEQGLKPGTKVLKLLNDEIDKYTEKLGIAGEEANRIWVEVKQLTIDDLDATRLAAEEKEALKILADEKEAERLVKEEEALAKKKEDKDEELEEDKKREAERETLIADILKFQVDSEKSLTALTEKQLKARLLEYQKTEKLKAEISQTFVDGFLGGIESMKSSSRDVLVSMIKGFVNFIAGKLAMMAAMNLAAIITAPIGLAQLAAAGVVKALGGSAANAIASAEQGMDSAPGGSVLVGEAGPEVVNIPKGSQIIPNHKINMSRFNTIPAFQNGTTGAGDMITNSGGNVFIDTVELAPETPADFRDKLMEFGESVNVDFVNP